MTHRSKKTITKGMILAAGEGSRMQPLTLNRPKPMLPLGKQPMLSYSLAWLRYYGIRQIAVNLHHCPQVVMDYFGNGSGFGVQIRYSLEETMLGTAGGVKRLSNFFDDTFVLLYGDVLTDFDLGALMNFHLAQPSSPHLSLSLYHVANPWECGIVSLDRMGRVLHFIEKPPPETISSDLAFAGVLIMDHALLDYIPANIFYDFGRDFIPNLIRLGIPIYGWPLPENSYLIDIGTPEKYLRVQQDWPTQRSRRFLQ